MNVVQAAEIYPLPLPQHLNEHEFLKRMQDQKFAETGPVTEGTKVVVTDLSLNYYLA